MKGKILAVVLMLLMFSLSAQTDEYPFPSLSPKGTISQLVGNTLLSIEYERPSARNRQVFGKLVPWGKVWRTGAGHCTKISFDQDVRIGGQKVAAGKYSLFTIPGPTEWIVILNGDTTLYGSFDYDYHQDIARFVVLPTESSRFYETLNFDIEILPNDAQIYLSWANVQISFAVETTTDRKVERLIEEELLTRKNGDSDIYAGAAEYLLYQGDNLATAIQLAAIAIEINENNEWARSLKIKLYEKMKLYEEALLSIEEYLQYAQERAYESEGEKENTISGLKSEQERISKIKN